MRLQSLGLVRAQGLIFSVVALLLALLSTQFMFGDSLALLLVLSVIILLLGVPHGALDPIFAQRIFGVKGLLSWTIFALLYLGLAACVVLFWYVFPTLWLVCFLLISVWHFSADLQPSTPWWARLSYGSAIIVLPVFRFSNELTLLFSFLIDSNASAALVAALQALLIPAWVLIALSLVLVVRTDRLSALELLSVSALMFFVPPLPAFTLYFCLMHGARHILRTKQQVAQVSVKSMFGVILLPMLGTLILMLFGWFFTASKSLEQGVVQVVFVGLAALTVPHMCLVQRAVSVSGGLNSL
jgi:Brp/Blh family beta-carotene 15,15'-monooxygenase